MPDLTSSFPVRESKRISATKESQSIAMAKLKLCSKDRSGGYLPEGKRDVEILRIIMQYLSDKGYKDSVSQLEVESSLILESSDVKNFKVAIDLGRWNDAKLLLGFFSLSDADVKRARYLITGYSFLENIRANDYAVCVSMLSLDEDISGYDASMQQSFVSLLLYNQDDPSFLARVSYFNWPLSRSELLEKLLSFVPEECLLPSKRLETLFSQAIAWQYHRCPFHVQAKPTDSLLVDHLCDRSKITFSELGTLKGHNDEVWVAQFSPNAKFLMTASKDNRIIIWDVKTMTEYDECVHSHPVVYGSWSHDGSKILSFCVEGDEYYIWNFFDDSMNRRKKAKCKSFPVSCSVVAACWVIELSSVAIITSDKRLTIFDEAGNLRYQLCDFRSNEVFSAVVEQKVLLYVICQEVNVRVFELPSYKEVLCLSLPASIMSTTLSRDGKYALCSLSNKDIQLWDLFSKKHLMTFKGHCQTKYVVKTAFIGAEESIVASGSEDGSIYLWERKTGKILKTLSGHTGIVNSVVWDPTTERIASVSDDGTTQLWKLSVSM